MEDIEDLSKMKVADLKKHLKNKGLPVNGNKTELVERLQAALETDEHPTLDSSGAVDEDEFDEEEILGGEDVDIGKITQEEEAAALAGSLRVKDDTLLIPETPPEKKKISLKRSEPVLSQASDNGTLAEAPMAEEVLEPEITTNSSPDKENSLTPTPEPKHKIIKLSDPSTESSLEARSKKFGTVKPDSEENRKQARANRFGVSPSNNGTNKKSQKLSMETGGTDLEKLKKRAERFGEVTSKSLSKLESLEKLKLRQSRFGSGASDSDKSEKSTIKSAELETELAKTTPTPTPTSAKVAVTAPSVDADDAKLKRAQRFAAAV